MATVRFENLQNCLFLFNQMSGICSISELGDIQSSPKVGDFIYIS